MINSMCRPSRTQEELSPILPQMLQNLLAKQSLQLQIQQHAAPGWAVNQFPAPGRQLCAHPFNGFHSFPQPDSRSTAQANLGIVIYSSFLSVPFSFCDPISSTHTEQVICSTVQNKNIKNKLLAMPSNIMILLELFQSSFLSSILFSHPHLLAPLWTEVKLYIKRMSPWTHL